MMVGLKQKRSGELFEGSYEGRSLLLGKSWGSARRVYRKKKNGTAVDLKGGRRREQETNKDLSGLGLSGVVLFKTRVLSLSSQSSLETPTQTFSLHLRIRQPLALSY